MTNVDKANSSYFVTVVPPKGTDVSAKPSRLYFSNVNQKATYSRHLIILDQTTKMVNMLKDM